MSSNESFDVQKQMAAFEVAKGKASLNIYLKTLWFSVTILMEQDQAAGISSRHWAANFSVR